MTPNNQPRNLDELLEVLPTLRRWRSVDANTLRKLLGRETKECTWCGEVVGGRRTKWCGGDCLEAFRLRCSPSYQVEHVAKRDNYICVMCKKNVKLDFVNHNQSVPYWQRKSIGHFCQADHILPVAEGGGLTGPENLRLLCTACHKTQTNKLHKRLAEKRTAKVSHDTK